MLPGYMFFVETINIPNELELSEIADFVELSLESIAPFPLDRLCWGYLYRKNASTLLIYAAHQERIKIAGFANLNDYAWVIPDFATLSGACFNDDTLVVLEGDQSISLLYFQNSAEIPKSVWVDTASESIEEKTIELLRANVRDLSKTAPTLHLRPPIIHMSESGIPTFEHAISENSSGSSYDGNWKMLTPTESELWEMDVRDSDFKTAEKSKRHTSALILRITGWAILFAVILILTEGLLFAAQNWLQTQFYTIERQQVAVSKVEEKQTLVNKLEQVAQNELRPIEMLEAANDIRLNLDLGIEYDEVIIEGENNITIEGKASSVNAINRYTDELQKSGKFDLLGTPETPTTRSGKTSFKISLVYVPNTKSDESSVSLQSEPVSTESLKPTGREQN